MSLFDCNFIILSTWLYNYYYYYDGDDDKDWVTPQNTTQTQTNKGNSQHHNWLRGAINNPQTFPHDTTAMHTQQCGPQDCK